MQDTLTSFKLGEHTLTLRVGDDAFKPTTVTQKIADSLHIPVGGKVLDLGCGTGPLGIYAALNGAAQVHSVDVMPQACEYAQENVDRAGLSDRITVMCGDLFEPVADQQYDLIINDVSGIAERVARISPWYPNPIPSGGVDGTDVVTRMLSQSPDHLKPGGVLHFAVSSLSAGKKIVAQAKAVYGSGLELLKSVPIPFCPELKDAATEMKVLRQMGTIDFEERKSRYLWTLELYQAKLT